jgi:hypothetical protein
VNKVLGINYKFKVQKHEKKSKILSLSHEFLLCLIMASMLVNIADRIFSLKQHTQHITINVRFSFQLVGLNDVTIKDIIVSIAMAHEFFTLYFFIFHSRNKVQFCAVCSLFSEFSVSIYYIYLFFIYI